MASFATSFTAVGVGGAINVKHGDSFSYSVSGTFVGTVVVERSANGGLSWDQFITKTAAASDTVLVTLPNQGSALFRFRCSVFTSGTIVTSIADVAKNISQRKNDDGDILMQLDEDGYSVLRRSSQKIIYSAGVLSKPGTTSGWIVGAADNINLATCPAAKTGSTLVVPLGNLKPGFIITAFHLVGQIESGGNTATVDASLRVMTAAAADVTDALVASMTQLSVTADTIMSSANTSKSSLSQTVAVDQTYYLLVTVTTAAATDIALQGVALTVTEV